MKSLTKWMALAITMIAAVALLAGCGGGEEKPTAAKDAAETTAAAPVQAEPIKVGAMIDLSGPTSEVGNPYAEGLKACATYINDNGGIAGRPLELLLEDTGYKAERGQDIYNRFVYQENVVAIQGFGTAVTQDLKQAVANDKKPNFSASYSADLTDPKQAPYNFFIAADYSTQLRAALKYFRDNWTGEGAPKLAFIYPDHPYGKTPIPAGKEYATELGFEIVGEENVSLSAKEADANPAIIRLRDTNPDYVWIGGTTKSTAAICKAAKSNGFAPTFFVDIWGADEDLVRLAGDAAEGVISLQAAAVYGQDVPGMPAVMKYSDNQPQMTHYVRGFASMLVMAEGLKIAAAQGEVSGETLKAALETLNDFDPMGLTPKISYTPDDHRPNMAVFLYRIEGGKLVFVAEQILERRAEWLGK
ncbi:MAG: ABC transporter substrate-binding protein [Desulfovibrionaceae bacterium]